MHLRTLGGIWIFVHKYSLVTTGNDWKSSIEVAPFDPAALGLRLSVDCPMQNEYHIIRSTKVKINRNEHANALIECIVIASNDQSIVSAPFTNRLHNTDLTTYCCESLHYGRWCVGNDEKRSLFKCNLKSPCGGVQTLRTDLHICPIELRQ